MASSTVALIILAVVVVLFITNKIPLPVTAMLGAMAMAAFGVMDYSDVFTPFTSQAILLLIGMMVMGQALTEVGIVEAIAKLLERFMHFKERKLMMVLCVLVAVVACMSNALVVVAAIMPIIDRICAESDGRITRTRLYLPICVASYYGCCLTSIGASSMLHVSGQLEMVSGTGFTFFDPLCAGLPALVVMLVYAATIGYRISERHFHFEETVPVAYVAQEGEVRLEPKSREFWITILVFCVTLFIMLGTSVPYGFAAMGAAFILILTRCVTIAVFQKISWSTIFTVVGAMSIGTGFEVSGAGQITTEVAMGLLGDFANSPFLVCCLIMAVATLLSNFMANNATVTIMLPIAFSMASAYGVSYAPFAIAVSVGALLSCCTPLCNANIAVSTRVGYPFLDYIKWGLPLNVLALLASCAGIYVAYFN